MDKNFQEVINNLSPTLYKLLNNVDQYTKNNTQEIRLKANMPISLWWNKEVLFLKKNSFLSKDLNSELYIVSQEEIDQSFKHICQDSIYSFQDQIKNGYITLENGHRVGLSGTAVIKKNKVTSLKDINALNIRISRNFNGSAEKILYNLKKDFSGILIAGPPNSGKTTLLRDLARLFSLGKFNGYQKVSVIDERQELAGVNSSNQEVLGFSNILSGYPKGEGMQQALRVLAPHIIICDEIGMQDEVKAVRQSLNAGVKIIASIHANSMQDLKKRPSSVSLIDTGAFDTIVLLSAMPKPGTIIFMGSAE